MRDAAAWDAATKSEAGIGGIESTAPGVGAPAAAFVSHRIRSSR